MRFREILVQVILNIAPSPLTFALYSFSRTNTMAFIGFHFFIMLTAMKNPNKSYICLFVSCSFLILENSCEYLCTQELNIKVIFKIDL